MLGDHRECPFGLFGVFCNWDIFVGGWKWGKSNEKAERQKREKEIIRHRAPKTGTSITDVSEPQRLLALLRQSKQTTRPLHLFIWHRCFTNCVYN